VALSAGSATIWGSWLNASYLPAHEIVFRSEFLIPEGMRMASSDWGLCKDCQWWQIDPEANIAGTTLGLCIEERLQPFHLRVSGNSGCNRYTPGEPARAAGSGAAPPTAKPQR
jgi:hypothetical protein